MISEKVVCVLCGDETTEDQSKSYTLFYGDGIVLEWHCHTCECEM